MFEPVSNRELAGWCRELAAHAGDTAAALRLKGVAVRLEHADDMAKGVRGAREAFLAACEGPAMSRGDVNGVAA